jgi:uncharacterized membrane protein (DUF373 family)
MKLFKKVDESCAVNLLQSATKVIAVAVCITLIASACILLWEGLVSLFEGKVDEALQDELFVLILLEMFYVIRSFIKYGSINVSIVINIGAIAAVKELIFQMSSLTWQLALAFSLVFISLGFLYFAEIFSFEKKQANLD